MTATPSAAEQVEAKRLWREWLNSQLVLARAAYPQLVPEGLILFMKLSPPYDGPLPARVAALEAVAEAAKTLMDNCDTACTEYGERHWVSHDDVVQLDAALDALEATP